MVDMTYAKNLSAYLQRAEALQEAAEALTEARRFPSEIEALWDAEVEYWKAWRAFTMRPAEKDPTPWAYMMLNKPDSDIRTVAREAEQVTGGFIFLPRPWFEQDKRVYDGLPTEKDPAPYFCTTHRAKQTTRRPFQPACQVHFMPDEQFEQREEAYA